LNQSSSSSNQQDEANFPVPGEYLDNSFFGGGNSRRGQSISWIIRYGYAKIIDGSYHCNIDRANCKESYSSSATTSILRHAKKKHNMDGAIGKLMFNFLRFIDTMLKCILLFIYNSS